MKSKTQKKNNYKAAFMILGLNGDFRSIKLDENNVIRKATKKEIEKINQITEVNYTFKYVIESEYKSNEKLLNSNEVFEVLNRVNFFLHYYTNGRTACPAGVKYIVTNNTPLSAGSLLDRKIKTYHSEEYLFNTNERRRIKLSWQHFNICDNLDNKSFKIAWHRYLYSLNRYSTEDKLIDQMIALEALILQNSEREGLGYRLTIRIITLLSKYYDRNQLAQFLKSTYNLRSKIVHGANNKDNQITFKGINLDLDSVILQLDKILKSIFTEYIEYWYNTQVPHFIDQMDRFIFTGVDYSRNKIIMNETIDEISDLNKKLKFVLSKSNKPSLTLDQINDLLVNSQNKKNPNQIDTKRTIELLNELKIKYQLSAVPGAYQKGETGNKKWYFEMF